MFEVNLKEEKDMLIAYLCCELDHHVAKRVREATDERLTALRPKILRIDFSAVTFMDSSGIGLILGRFEKAKEFGGRVILTGLGERLLKILKYSGILRIHGIDVES